MNWKLIDKIGGVNDCQSKSVKFAGRVFGSSFFTLSILIIFGVIDHFLLAEALRAVLSLIAKVALSGIGIGVVLIILTTNEMI